VHSYSALRNSSFIFKREATVLDIKREVNKELLRRSWLQYSDVIISHNYSLFRNDYLHNGLKMLHNIETHLQELKDLDHAAICDIFERYSLDVVKSLFWFHKVEDLHNCKPDEKFEQIINWDYDEKQLQIIFTQVLLSFLTYTAVDPLDFNVLLSHEVIDELLEWYLDNSLVPVYECYELMRGIFEVHQEDGIKFFKSLNKTPAELMEEHLGIHYVYYTKELCNSILAEVVLGLPSCADGFVFRRQ